MPDDEKPEGPPARCRTDPAATVGPSGQVLRGTLAVVPGPPPASPFVGLWGLPNLPTRTASWPTNRTSRCAQSALRLSQGVPFGFPVLRSGSSDQRGFDG